MDAARDCLALGEGQRINREPSMARTPQWIFSLQTRLDKLIKALAHAVNREIGTWR